MARLATALKAYTKNPATLSIGAAAKPKAAVAKPAAPAAPAAAPIPAPAAPLPWDANYETAIGRINRDQTSGLASLANEETGVKQSYGFDDLSDPFSRLRWMQEKFTNQKNGTTNSFAAQGQLYSGAVETQRGADQHGYDVEYDTTKRDYQSALDSIAARRTGINNQAEDAIGTAGWERTQAALANRPDPASVPVAPAAAPTAPAAAKPAAQKDYTERPGKDSKGRPGVWHDYKDGRKPVFVPRG